MGPYASWRDSGGISNDAFIRPDSIIGWAHSRDAAMID